MDKLRVLFFGSSKVSEEFLSRLAGAEQVAGVITRPDRPAGRGQKEQPTPVKTLAERTGLTVLSPSDLKDREFLSAVKGLGADLGIVVSYGRILPGELYSIPPCGCVNVHFSLLPKYRGAAPIQWALINGEKITGVTTFLIDGGLDTGQIYLQKETAIGPNDDFPGLEKKLAALGVDAMLETLDAIKNKIPARPQSGKESLAPPLKKEDGRISWKKTAVSVVNLIRGTAPWPGAYTSCAVSGESKILKISEASAEENIAACGSAAPGTIAEIRKGLGFSVACGEGSLLVKRVRLEGKNEMPAWSFWQGARLKTGDKLD